MAVVEQYPYVDESGNEDYNLVKHSSDNAKPIIQLETGREYEEAIDVYPCKYTYIEKEEQQSDGEFANENISIADNYS